MSNEFLHVAVLEPERAPDTTCVVPPSVRYPKLFPAMCGVRMGDKGPYVGDVGVREDGIDIADAQALYPDEVTNDAWDKFEASHAEGYTVDEIRTLAVALFIFPTHVARARETIAGEIIREHCLRVLRASVRRANADTSSQLGVNEDVMEPGGRFSWGDQTAPETPEEAAAEKGHARWYNWDMGPTLRGAIAGMRMWGIQQARKTLANYKQLADRLDGRLPNVNAPWGADRNHPPEVMRVARSYATHHHELPEDPAEREAARGKLLVEQIPLLEAHFMHWRDGADDPEKLGPEAGKAYRRVVRMPNGKFMYRHWADGNGPRDEMYRHDMLVLAQLDEYLQAHEGRTSTEAEQTLLFKSLRASAESGEDFRVADSLDHKNLYLLRTIELVPIKLNSMMYEYACTLAYAYHAKAAQTTDPTERTAAFERAAFYEQEAQDLADCIHEYCLTNDDFCADYDFVRGKTEEGKALAGVFALGAGVFSRQRGQQMLDVVDERFFRDGGLVNTLYESDQQWDKNAWPIMQLESIDAAILYGRFDLAYKWAYTWLAANNKMFAKHHVLYEKSNPDHPGEPGGKGEYECVEDLLMTLGVDLALREMLPWLEQMTEQRVTEQQAAAPRRVSAQRKAATLGTTALSTAA